MKQKKKLVFLDIDGTLLPKTHRMTEKVIEAVKEAKERGHYLCICSGRAFCEIPADMKNFDGIISAAGACIMWKGQILLAEYLSGQEMEKAARLLEETGAIYIMEGLDYLYMKEEGRKRILGMLAQADEEEQHALDFFQMTVPRSSLKEMEKVHKCSFFYAEKEGSWLQEKLERYGLNVAAFSQSDARGNSGEITKAAFNKGTAVRYLSNYLGVAIEDTIAIGDSENDINMLEAAGIGIAMGNALDYVKRVADDVTKSVEEDGVYYAFLKYGLIS